MRDHHITVNVPFLSNGACQNEKNLVFSETALKNRSIWIRAHLAVWHTISGEHNLVAWMSKHIKFK